MSLPCSLVEITRDSGHKDTVPAWYVERGLAVTFDPMEGGYVVSHVATGMAVTGVTVATEPEDFERVRNVQVGLLDLGDWTLPGDVLKADESFRAAVSTFLQERCLTYD